MKDNNMNIKWLIPMLGVAVVAGGLMGAATHSKLEQEAHFGEAWNAALDRVYLDEGLCCVLRSLHEGDVKSAAQRLDVLLCHDILNLNSELATAEGADHVFIKNAFGCFSLMRPTCATRHAATGQEPTGDQMEAERILAQTGREIAPGNRGLATAP